MGAVIAFVLYLTVVVGAVWYYMDQAQRYAIDHPSKKTAPICFQGVCNSSLKEQQNGL